MNGKNSMHNITLRSTYYARVTRVLPCYAPITDLLRTYYAPITILRTYYAPITILRTTLVLSVSRNNEIRSKLATKA